MNLEHWDHERDGPLDEAALTRKLQRLGYSVTRYVYPPGTYFPPHSHRTDKIDAVLSGVFRMTLEGTSLELTAGDWLMVPAGVLHSAEVIGELPVVSLDAVRHG
jgi:quercetin dioxygenase-like cupin family protein